MSSFRWTCSYLDLYLTLKLWQTIKHKKTSPTTNSTSNPSICRSSLLSFLPICMRFLTSPSKGPFLCLTTTRSSWDSSQMAVNSCGLHSNSMRLLAEETKSSSWAWWRVRGYVSSQLTMPPLFGLPALVPPLYSSPFTSPRCVLDSTRPMHPRLKPLLDLPRITMKNFSVKTVLGSIGICFCTRSP